MRRGRDKEDSKGGGERGKRKVQREKEGEQKKNNGCIVSFMYHRMGNFR